MSFFYGCQGHFFNFAFFTADFVAPCDGRPIIGFASSCFGFYLVGTSTGAPLSFTKNTTNFAGLVWLAFRPTT